MQCNFYEGDKLGADRPLPIIVSHCLHRFLDNQKNTFSQFSVPGLREIHRNLKQNKQFTSCKSFFRKSPSCNFFCINPGFVGPWDKLGIIFLIVIFMMFQRMLLAEKIFEFQARVQKCYFGNFSILPRYLKDILKLSNGSCRLHCTWTL